VLQSQRRDEKPDKKAGTIAGPGLFCWLVARIKSRFQGGKVSKFQCKNQTPKPEALKL
jgi:hypothetical protein